MPRTASVLDAAPRSVQIAINTQQVSEIARRRTPGDFGQFYIGIPGYTGYRSDHVHRLFGELCVTAYTLLLGGDLYAYAIWKRDPHSHFLEEHEEYPLLICLNDTTQPADQRASYVLWYANAVKHSELIRKWLKPLLPEVLPMGM